MILNSTPGKVGMLLVRTNLKPSYPSFSIDELLRIPMPAVGKLGTEQMLLSLMRLMSWQSTAPVVSVRA